YNNLVQKLNRMGLTNNNVCWKCQKDRGTFIHCIWECPLIQPLWLQTLNILSKWLGITIPLSPRLCLLGDREQLPNITNVPGMHGKKHSHERRLL
uniref:Reverse transcriptase zinc-binding domain-containing protein n=1 Tax=Cyprinus carpio carpio TaxID=630221 RepID=A0A9J8C2G9_CYPCA